MKIPINLNNPMHQYILVKLTLMYYSAGDVKGVYEDQDFFDIIAKEFKLRICWRDAEIEQGSKLLDDDWPGFGIMAKFLDREKISHIYQSWEYLKVMPDTHHMG
jgi:hypothetical protein